MKFTARDYTVRHIPHYVSPTAQAWTEEERDRILVEDAKAGEFRFTGFSHFYYIPAGEHTQGKTRVEITEYRQRDKVVKTATIKIRKRPLPMIFMLIMPIITKGTTSLSLLRKLLLILN